MTLQVPAAGRRRLLDGVPVQVQRCVRRSQATQNVQHQPADYVKSPFFPPKPI